jgi:hypothetical protein
MLSLSELKIIQIPGGYKTYPWLTGLIYNLIARVKYNNYWQKFVNESYLSFGC